ncbi:MAG: serine protease [Bdellovibrio sp.]
MSRIIMFLCFLILSLQTAHAQSLPLETWKKSVVKTLSFPCISQHPLFEGTGLLIEFQHKIQVLTSEHVVIHSRDKSYCHDILTADGKRLRTQLDFFSFNAGVAFLIPEEAHGLPAVRLALPHSPFNVEPEVLAMGYPKSSSQLQILRQGKVLSTTSRRGLIPSAPASIEVAQLPAEYGMSGGILLSSESSGLFHLRGFLSHQILRRTPSQGSRVENIDNASSPSPTDLTFALPLGDLPLWTTASASDVWTRDAKDQLEGKETVCLRSLCFTPNKTVASDIFAIGGRDFGGADGSGIGGADGSGIGGAETPQNAEILYSVEVRFKTDISSTIKSQSFSNTTLEKWRISLLRGHRVHILFFTTSEQNRLTAFYSLSQFLTLFLEGSSVAVSTLSGPNSPSDLFHQSLKKTLHLTQMARDLATSTPMKSWFGYLRDQLLLAENGIINSSQVADLTGNLHDEFWQNFYEENFDQAVDLAASLQSLTGSMKRLGL